MTMRNDTGVESQGRIVLADDSMVVRAMVRQVLEGAGYSVEEAENGELAHQLILRSMPEVIILNVEMPVLTGHQLLRRLKADPKLWDIPVIFLTGRTSTDEIVEGLRMGAQDYLRKPFEPAELIARVSAAIRVARLQQRLTSQNAELAVLSRTDQLTSLHNRRYGDERLRAEIHGAERQGRRLSVLMVDLDHFKTVNDLFGHASGDAVLREFSQRLLAVLRLSDVAIRWGGEEFLVILPDTDLAGARMIADRLIAAMRARPIELTNGQLRTVTVSIGAAQCNHANPETLLREVDDALYRAKGQGRDRLCVAPAEPADTHRNGGEESRDSARHDG